MTTQVEDGDWMEIESLAGTSYSPESLLTMPTETPAVRAEMSGPASIASR
jgi:hypothetical protein